MGHGGADWDGPPPCCPAPYGGVIWIANELEAADLWQNLGSDLSFGIRERAPKNRRQSESVQDPQRLLRVFRPLKAEPVDIGQKSEVA